MEIDKLKLASTIKLGMLGLYSLYIIIFNTSFNLYLPEYKYGDAFKKKILIGDHCILFIGGSNVRQGISAKMSSERICPALNLGFTSEFGGFDIYINWLKENLGGRRYSYVLYSPALFWGQKSIIEKNQNIFEFPGTSIFAQLKNFINYDDGMTFNSWGDTNNYKCSSNFVSYEVNQEEFRSASASIVKELSRRVLVLEATIKVEKLYLRVPPVYVKTKNQAELYANLIMERIKMLNELGVGVVGSTIVTTDNSLFCDSFHPNATGREVFTKEIRLP